jgi:acyl transferase domain-containing protein
MADVSGSKTSVFSGCFTDDYRTLYHKDPDDTAPYAATGITTTLNANRVSWFFNTLGTSVNIDTACSSSLVALDLACQSLRSEDCNAVGLIIIFLRECILTSSTEYRMRRKSHPCYGSFSYPLRYEHALRR